MLSVWPVVLAVGAGWLCAVWLPVAGVVAWRRDGYGCCYYRLLVAGFVFLVAVLIFCHTGLRLWRAGAGLWACWLRPGLVLVGFRVWVFGGGWVGGCLLFVNCIVDASIFVAKFFRAHGGCLGIRSR